MYPSVLLLLLSLIHQRGITAEECGTRFTDFTSSVVLAEVVLQGSIKEFNQPPLSNHPRTANVSMMDVYKGMSILKSIGKMHDNGIVEIQSFGQENLERCVVSDDEAVMGKPMVFFLRRAQNRNMMEHSALPVVVEGDEKHKVKRSLCDTCIQPPTITHIVCRHCAKEPTIRPLKSRKVTLGRRARLRCNARGKPKPKIKWFKNDIPILSGNGGITIRNTSLSSTLIFTSTTSAHGGLYTCVASNEIGETEGEVTLEVSRRPRKRKKETAYNSVKDASDKVVCEANPCNNGGTCYFSPSLNLRQCVCASGFEGVTCENILSSDVEQVSDNEPTIISPLTTDKTSSIPPIRHDMKNTSVQIMDLEKVDNSSHTSSQLASRINQSSAGEITSQVLHITTTTIKNVNIINTTNNMKADMLVNNVNNEHRPNQSPTSHHTHPAVDTSNTRSSYSVLSKTKTRPKSSYSPNGERLSRYPVKRKSSLKIIPCLEKNYCMNRGKCRFIRKLNKKFCHCRTGYAGSRCERALV